MIYRFDVNQDGVLVAESVTFNRTLDQNFADSAESKQEQQTVNDTIRQFSHQILLS